jgi:NRPS condensation-like uncharacterized protein
MSPGPWSAFDVGARLAGVALVVSGWRVGGWLGGLFIVFGALALLRVVSRRLVVELALAQVLVAAAIGERCTDETAAIACAVGTLLVLVLAPERRRLPLNGMDRYFVAQDYPGTPVNSHICVELAALPDRASLAAATAALGRDVPMLRTFLREAALGVERFEARRAFGGERLRWATEASLGDDPSLLHARFDLRREPPYRVACTRSDGGGATIVLTLHHSACDGEGLLIALDYLIQRYNEALAKVSPAPLALTVEGLRFRDVVRARGKGLGWLWQMIRRHLRPLDKVGVKNASLLDDTSPVPHQTRHHLSRIDEAAWRGIGDAMKGRELTRNDLLLAAALRAADAHQRERGRPDRPFRVLLPANLRAQLELGPGLQNFLGVLRAEFTVDEVRSPRLHEVVHERVREGRSLEDAVETPVNLGVLTLLLPPWLMRRALKKLDLDAESSFFSFLFSHMRAPELKTLAGVATRAVSIRGSLARRPGFGVALTREAAGLAVTIEYLHPLVSDASAAAFARRFGDEVAQTPMVMRATEASSPSPSA